MGEIPDFDLPVTQDEWDQRPPLPETSYRSVAEFLGGRGVAWIEHREALVHEPSEGSNAVRRTLTGHRVMVLYVKDHPLVFALRDALYQACRNSAGQEAGIRLLAEHVSSFNKEG